MLKKNKELWLDQMYVFPDGEGNFAHDEPYVVEYEATTGKTRTRVLESEEASKVRLFNNFPEPVSEVANA